MHDIDQISDDSCPKLRAGSLADACGHVCTHVLKLPGYTTECLYQAQCDPGYYAVESGARSNLHSRRLQACNVKSRNNPCYSDDVFPAWRECEPGSSSSHGSNGPASLRLHCCRQQRNINGYLRGFEARWAKGVPFAGLFSAKKMWPLQGNSWDHRRQALLCFLLCNVLSW